MEKVFVPSPFPFVDCVFDSRKDLKETDQVGFLDLNNVYATGVVSGIIDIKDESFNGVDDPSVLLPRPKDIFERWRQADFVRASLDVQSSKSDVSVSTD